MSMIEHKFFALTGEFKLADTQDEMRFKGYGAVFNNIDSYGDVIEPGAFAVTLDEAKRTGLYPSMLLQHGGYGFSPSDMMPIGVWDKLSEDSVGLFNEGVLADTTMGLDTYKLMKMKPRPAITGLSIGYIAKKSTLRSKPEEPRRRLHEIDLREISIVTFPANSRARVTDVKSSAGFTEREFEQLLRDVGYSVKEAKTIISRGFRAVSDLRDAESKELGELAAVIRRNSEILKRS